MGKFDKLPGNRLVDVLWEVGPGSGSVVRSMFVFCVVLQVELEGSTMTAVKPKMFLTCSMVLERDQWVKLA